MLKKQLKIMTCLTLLLCGCSADTNDFEAMTKLGDLTKIANHEKVIVDVEVPITHLTTAERLMNYLALRLKACLEWDGI